MKSPTTIKRFKTSDFPYRVTYTVIVSRQLNGKTYYTVATDNNCIQANFEDLKDAENMYLKLIQDHLNQN